MPLLFVSIGILFLILLILKKVNPMLALLMACIACGLMLGMPVKGILTSVSNGIGSTLGGTIMVLALGAMLGKISEESGAAQRIIQVLMNWFGMAHIQWAILCTGILVGIPLFYNAGFVVLIPLVFALAASARLPLLYVGIPMAAALSVTHGFLPPHPGPVALSGIFGADMGKTMLYGLLLTVPVSIIAGIAFPRLIRARKIQAKPALTFDTKSDGSLPPGWKSFIIVLMPVLLIAIGTAGVFLAPEGNQSAIFYFLQDPAIALLCSLFASILLLKWPMKKAMSHAVEGVAAIAMIILIIAAGGAFKQILIDSAVGETIRHTTEAFHLSPLFLGWMVAALFRITLGSATVAALTASGIVAPFISGGVSAELMVLSVGAGSLFCSHVNDTGFWMFKEYFGLSLKQTFLTWTLMESIISLLGLTGVLLLAQFIG